MKKSLLPALVYLVLASLPSTYGQKTESNKNAETEKALRNLDAQWSAAATAKDLEKGTSFYADDAIVLPPNARAATTKETVRKVWKDMLDTPGLAIGWKPTRVEVAHSGDIGYVTGTYELTMNDADGKPVHDLGKYLEVWKKQANGEWKCVADTWNSDLPPPALPPAPAEKK